MRRVPYSGCWGRSRDHLLRGPVLCRLHPRLVLAQAMNVQLVRFAYLDSATLGYLYAGPLRLATIERPWLPHPDGPGGRTRLSCIPDGTYTIAPWDSTRFPGTYILSNPAHGVYRQPGDIPPGQTWGRSAILIHVGNFVSDVVGCIAVGVMHSHERLMVMDSRAAMHDLRGVLSRNTHTLQIRPVAGTQEAA